METQPEWGRVGGDGRREWRPGHRRGVAGPEAEGQTSGSPLSEGLTQTSLPLQPFPGWFPKHHGYELTFQNHSAQFKLPAEVATFHQGILQQGDRLPRTKVARRADINNVLESRIGPEERGLRGEDRSEEPPPEDPARSRRGPVL